MSTRLCLRALVGGAGMRDSHDRHGVPRCKHCGAPPSTTGGATATRSPPMTSASAPRSATSAGTGCAPTSPLSLTGFASATAKAGSGRPGATIWGPSASSKTAPRASARKAGQDAGSDGHHGCLWREGRAARPGQANTALKTGPRRTRRVAVFLQAQETDRPPGMTPGRPPASSRESSPTARSRRLEPRVKRPPAALLTPKDAPAPNLETEASN
jgi:hypothetical protein